jgi:putative hydrolase of the HAD superfamily
VPIGVPRFELGTSPTRTERATRLRHTPSRESVARTWGNPWFPRGPPGAGRGGPAILARVLKAVLFDVDFTLSRPGPELGPEGYRRVGERHGLVLDPSRYEQARLAAIDELQRRTELVHDEEVWVAFTEHIVVGMGGDPEASRACAVEMVREWERHENFSLYEDTLPVLEELRRRGLKLGLVSNGQRDLDEFAAHHALEVDVVVGSRAHGRRKPDPTIFEAALSLLGVAAAEAAMVGDSREDDVEGARSLGMRAILLDREGRYPDAPDRIPDLWALPAALGLDLGTGPVAPAPNLHLSCEG